MKRTLLILSILAGGYSATAQCTPDPSVTDPISPDTATNMAVSYVGQSYSQVFTFVVPDEDPDSGAEIDHVELESITGLPSNYAYQCNPSDCNFPALVPKCVDVYSTTPPTSGQIGTHVLTITALPYINFFGGVIASPTGSTVFEGYYLVIADQGSVGVEQVSQGQMKSLIAYPNPTSGNTTIEFAMGYSNEVTFVMTNLIGEVVNTQKLAANKGLNSFKLDATNFSNGIYLYTITDGINSISKKLTVNK